jgi:protein-disulfide isomerase
VDVIDTQGGRPVGKQRRNRNRNRILGAGGGIVIAGLLIAIVIALVNAAGGKAETTATPGAPGAPLSPANATPAGALVIGRADAPVRLEVYLDYMCPYCGRFERANADEIGRLVAAGAVRLELYPLSFLDGRSAGSRYSTRAANAVATVADRAPDKVLAFNRALYAQQPKEGGAGLTDDRIATLAAEAGVPQDVVAAFGARTFEPWIARLTETAFGSGGVTGTPTVKINGKVFKGDLYTAGPLTDAVTAARGG